MKIRNTLILYFLIVLLVPISVLSFVHLRNSQINLESQIKKNLEINVDARKTQLDHFAQSYIATMQTFARNPALAAELAQYNTSSTSKRRNELDGILKHSLSSLESAVSLTLIDPLGVIVASTDNAQVGVHVNNERFFIEGKKGAEGYFTNENGITYISFVAPIYSKGIYVGLAWGVVHADVVENILQNRSGLGETGEAILGTQSARGEVTFVSKRRYEEQTVPSLENSIPMRTALNEKETVLTAVSDYRGVPVMAATRYLPSMNAGLVVKIDRSEASAPLRNVLMATIVVTLFGIVLAILVAWFLSNNFTDPILALAEVTKNVSKENLNAPFSKELLESPNEIGVLSRNFKSMMNTLARMYEDEKKEGEKMKELSQRNEKILNSAGEGIYGVDKTGNILFINASASHMLGYDAKEMIGKNSHELFHYKKADGSPYPFEECPLSRSLKIGEVIRGQEEVFWTRDGKGIEVEHVNTPLVDNGKVIGDVVVFGDITERNRAEEALHESEEKYRRLFEAAKDGILILDADTGAIKNVNPFLCKMLGYTEGELLGAKIWEISPFKDIAANKDALVQLKKKEYARYENLPLQSASGQSMQVEFVSNVYTVGDRQVIQCNVRDITERKRAEKVVLESEQKFSAAFNTSPDLMAITRLSDGKILEINDGYSQMLGYSRDESLGKTTGELAIWAKADDRRKFVDMLQKDGQVLDFETTLRRKDGTTVTVLDSARPFSLQGESCILSTAHDITDRKEAEEKLREQQKHAQSLLRFSKKLELAQTYGEALSAAKEEVKNIFGYNNVWAYLITEDKQHLRSIVAAGPEEQTIMTEGERGTALLTIAGDPMLEAIVSAKDIVVIEDAQIDERVNKEIVKWMKNRTIINVPIILFDKNLGTIGTGTFGEEGVRTPTDLEKEYLKALASHVAVSFDRIRLLDERKYAEERLKELDKLKDDFLMVVTHELKSPLLPIKSQSQLLLAGDHGEINQEQRKAIEMIFRNEEVINTLASEVLDISKIKSNKLQLAPEMTPLNDVVTSVVDDMKGVAAERQLSFALSPVPDMPPIMIDGARVRQVMRNLLDNAMKFTPEQGTVGIEVRKSEHEIEVRVSDSGIGIPREAIPKLFVPFYRVESDVTRKYRGTGLGLAICKGLIEAHGGRIWAESEGAGRGSTFVFTLPITPTRDT